MNSRRWKVKKTTWELRDSLSVITGVASFSIIAYLLTALTSLTPQLTFLTSISVAFGIFMASEKIKRKEANGNEDEGMGS